MRIKASTIVAGGALYLGAAATSYLYIKRAQEHGASAAADAGGDGAHASAFDRLAAVYDERVGSEERYMAYGLLRWCVACCERHARTHARDHPPKTQPPKKTRKGGCCGARPATCSRSRPARGATSDTTTPTSCRR